MSTNKEPYDKTLRTRGKKVSDNLIVYGKPAYSVGQASLEQKAKNRGIAPEKTTEMGWEVYPEGIYQILKQFAAYKNLPPIIITENGAAFEDVVQNGRIHDQKRVQFYQEYLKNVLRAKREGIDIRGYFAWSFMDNFEWAEGYGPRFGLVHVDYASQKRTLKDSGLWFQDFLK